MENSPCRNGNGIFSFYIHCVKSVRMENTDQKNSEYEHFSRSDIVGVPIPVQGFPSSDWSKLNFLVTHLTNIVNFASKTYPGKTKSDAKVDEWD